MITARPVCTLVRRQDPTIFRHLYTSARASSHDNPLGLPRNNAPPTMPRRSAGPPKPKPIPKVTKVVAVSSAKGGVGKSTVAVNLALALGMQHVQDPSPGSSASLGARPLRVGLLDLDIFGPSVPLLMGLEGHGEPDLSGQGALLPLKNHGMPCMSMGFLLPPDKDGASSSAPVVWRGLMVMKAVQQLLFDVDWSGDAGSGLDVLVVDMPPGTGDVALTLSQLVQVDGAVVVSTPQEVALADARKGVAMFEKVNVPILGMVMNMSHFTAPDTGKRYSLFGSPQAFDRFAERIGVPVLGRLPLEPSVSTGGDAGAPVVLTDREPNTIGYESSNVFRHIGKQVWQALGGGQTAA